MTEEELYVLYKTYRHYVFEVAMEILKDKGYAEEALQESMIKIIDNADLIDTIDSLRTRHFIFKITRNTAIDFYRKRKRIWEHEFSIYDADMVFSDNTAETLESSPLMDGIQQLDSKYRDVIKLKYIFGFRCREIADILGINEVLVRKRLSRGRKLLERKVLSE